MTDQRPNDDQDEPILLMLRLSIHRPDLVPVSAENIMLAASKVGVYLTGK